MAEPGVVVTDEDVDALNRATMARAAAFVRLAGSVLVAAGATGVAAWLWLAIRTQQNLSSSSVHLTLGGQGAPLDFDLVDRLDLLTASFGLLMTSVLVVGFGLLLRLIADFVDARSGGTLTGFVPGDVLT